MFLFLVFVFLSETLNRLKSVRFFFKEKASSGVTGFHASLSGNYRVLFDQTTPRFTGFYRVSPDSTGFPVARGGNGRRPRRPVVGERPDPPGRCLVGSTGCIPCLWCRLIRRRVSISFCQ